MDFKNYICPVCNLRFNDDDDIVVCPDCGTPHHRECYKKEGNCFNAHLHGTDEDLKSSFSVKEKEKIKDPNEDINFSLPSEKKDDNEEKILPVSEIFKNFGEQISSSSPASTHLIEGKPAVYYEIAVKKSQNYYIPRFITISDIKKGIFPNVAALILPFTWCIYRKMYKFAAIFLAIYTLIGGVTFFNMYANTDIYEVTQKCVEEDPYFFEDVLIYIQDGTGRLTENQKKFIEETQKGQLPGSISIIFSILIYGSKFLFGLKATDLYMKKIRKSIDSGEKKGLRGDALKAYIYRKNGTLPIIIAVLFAMIELMFI